jgi:uncharacterized damage-inducible protein DinB
VRKEVERVKEQLRRAHEGEAWHGPSLSEILKRVAPSHADAKPVPKAHSIRELLTHILVWEQEAIERLNGGGHPALPPEKDWPEGAPWEELVARSDEVHRALMAVVDDLDDERLEERVPGNPPTVYDLLHGIVQHNLYHAGQIALLTKAFS